MWVRVVELCANVVLGVVKTKRTEYAEVISKSGARTNHLGGSRRLVNHDCRFQAQLWESLTKLSAKRPDDSRTRAEKALDAASWLNRLVISKW